MRKIMMSVYLSEEQKIALDELSRRTDVSVACYIRRAIDEYLKKNVVKNTKKVVDRHNNDNLS